MSPWLPEALRPRPRGVIGIDRHQLCWQAGGEAARVLAHALVASDSGTGLAPALAQVLPDGLQAGTVDVVAGNDLAVWWLQIPPQNAASLDELRAVAALRCAHLFGGSPVDWQVAGDWQARQPFVCWALPQRLVRGMAQALTAQRLQPRWHSTTGLLLAGAAHLFPASGWCCIQTPLRAVVWYGQAGVVHSLACMPVSPVDPVAAVQGWIVTESARAGLGAEATLHWLDLSGSPRAPADAGPQLRRLLAPGLQPRPPAGAPATEAMVAAAVGLAGGRP